MGQGTTLDPAQLADEKVKLGKRKWNDLMRIRGIDLGTARRLVREYWNPAAADQRRAANTHHMRTSRDSAPATAPTVRKQPKATAPAKARSAVIPVPVLTPSAIAPKPALRKPNPKADPRWPERARQRRPEELLEPEEHKWNEPVPDIRKPAGKVLQRQPPSHRRPVGDMHAKGVTEWDALSSPDASEDLNEQGPEWEVKNPKSSARKPPMLSAKQKVALNWERQDLSSTWREEQLGGWRFERGYDDE